MRRLIIPLLLILCAYLGLIIFSNRALLFSRFDETYWKNKYEQSQWKLPLSVRTIGDDGLYLFEGYRLIHGGDPTSSNAEMPPFGKYLIGISITVFGNGYLYGFFVTVFLLIGVYMLAKTLFKETVLALFVTILLATDPLITNQYTLTMMDSLQALLLVIYFYVLYRIHTAPHGYRMWYAGLSGLILGLFSVTKLPVLSPVLLLVGGLYVWITTKNLRHLLFLLIGGVIGYMVPYAGYFLHGHTFTDWLKIQKWIVSFYLHSNLVPTWGSAISVLFTGLYQNIFSREWLSAAEWSPVWGVLVISTIVAGVTRLRTHEASHRTHDILLITLCAIVGIYAVIPFWTRYFVVILPLLYLVGMEHSVFRLPNRARIGIFFLLLVVNVSASATILFRTPEATVQQYIYNTEHLVFADIYEDTTDTFKKTTQREAFTSFGFSAVSQGEIEFIDISPINTLNDRWTSPQYLTATATFFTRRLGSFTIPITIPFVREHGRWRIPWDWSLFLPELSRSTRLVSQVDEAKRGSILGTDKKPLAEDINGHMIWITPNLTDKTREPELLMLLEKLFGGRLPKVAIHHRFVGNTAPDIGIPIGVISYDESNPMMDMLRTFPGITITPAVARETQPSDVVAVGTVSNTTYPECCSFLYTTTAYNGTSGIEQTQNATLKGTNGGTLQLIDEQGKILKEFIHATKKNGATVQL